MRVGVIGLGAMGKNHIRVLSQMQQVQEILAYDITNGLIPEEGKIRLMVSREELALAAPSYVVVALPT